MLIQRNIEAIRERIERACDKAGLKRDTIKLVAVTKTVDVQSINKAVECGITLLGENKVQEIVEKTPLIEGNVEWHMIGHLQTNKVRYIADKVKMIHSVDSIKLVEEINKRFKNHSRIIDILVEINIGREDSKNGIAPENIMQFLQDANKYENIHIMGLMTVAPACDNVEKVRPYFREMKKIFENIKSENIENVNMESLSMGMTNDFEIAIEEGTNMVRIGSGIFGPRKY